MSKHKKNKVNRNDSTAFSKSDWFGKSRRDRNQRKSKKNKRYGKAIPVAYSSETSTDAPSKIQYIPSEIVEEIEKKKSTWYVSRETLIYFFQLPRNFPKFTKYSDNIMSTSPQRSQAGSKANKA